MTNDSDGFPGSGLPVRRITGDPQTAPIVDSWWSAIPAVRQLLDDGLDLGRLTVLVGENGSGKSTLVEAIALAFGMSAEGGSTGARHTTRATESDLHEQLALTRGAGGARWGFFLRAETMHGFYSYLEENPGRSPDPKFHEMSHGESFLSLLDSRFRSPGLYVLDEPEAALSFHSSLALVDLLGKIAASDGSQAVVATHSPIIAATPGAKLYEVGDWGLRRSQWEDLEVVGHWQGFLRDPHLFLRHLG